MRSRAHQRLGRAVTRYADGELDAVAVRTLEAHLLECESCRQELATVRAIKASLRRIGNVEPPTLAATRLRRWVEHPAGLCGKPWSPAHDRVGILAGSKRYRRRVQVGALAVVVAVIAATGAWFLRRQSAVEPGPVRALVELARIGPPISPAAENGQNGDPLPPAHMVELGGRTVSLIRYRVDGREVLIAASDRAFAMPADARPVSDERDAPWLASRGDVNLACLSQPVHRLVVGALPPERLLEIGRRLPDG
ncbi:MAG: zf-HC2 domain-containing protein [Actinomycetota bacterium]|jgi:hypothetical protein